MQAALDSVLNQVAELLRDLIDRPEAAKLYAPGRPVIRLVSSLAEGSDRLLARSALALGWKLAVLLPFPRAEYEKDFPESTADFADLLAQAGSELVGAGRHPCRRR